MRVPLTAEASWLSPQGRRPYWRGTIASLAYEFADEPGIGTTTADRQLPAHPNRGRSSNESVPGCT
jgi:hypothetical protein